MIKMIENCDVLFGDELTLDNLQVGALGTQDTENLNIILLNEKNANPNRISRSSVVSDQFLETFTMDDSVDEDEIFNQMKEADEEEAKRRQGDKSTAATVNQDEVENQEDINGAIGRTG